ncbi:MAG: NAD-dependent epimerase/dehydratase family protein [Candidatus Sumerlaeota bacterium]|nr:NAD-dependent epimerase/dehydratase family protein [Candidatus Sumerlaeota bacterium]
MDTILVTGGAGYVGAVLVPKLLKAGKRVRVLDLMIFGEDVLDSARNDPRLEIVKGDMRDAATTRRALQNIDCVINLACISNDPSSDLDPELTRQINRDSIFQLVDLAKQAKVRRFINASSSSVYGIKEAPNVTEDLPLEPLTLYSKYKAETEEMIRQANSPGFVTVSIRLATVCGYSPRLRLDLTVNILTNLAINTGRITVFGGTQKRPNIHIEDITDLYMQLLEEPGERIAGKVWNAGWDNMTVAAIAELVRDVVGKDGVEIVTTPTNDLRSYHISSERIKRELGFVPRRSIRTAIEDLKAAFEAGKVPRPMDDIRYYNVKLMKAIQLK